MAGQPLREGIFYKFDSCVKVKLLHNLAFMKFDGAGRNFESPSDVLDRMALC